MSTRFLNARTSALVLAVSALTLAGCGKVSEVASEKAVEKMMEAQINEKGSNAKVDLSKGGVTAEGTDENGKAFKVEMGSAQLTEADVKIPFYPGAKAAEKGGSRFKNGGGEMVSLELLSTDSAKKVSDWYRDKLKSNTEGKTVMDQAGEDNGMSLMIGDSKAGESTTVSVTPDGDGSKILLMHAVNDKSAAQ